MSQEPLDLASLRPSWTADDIGGFGRTAYEAVPSRERPKWAGAILKLVASKGGSSEEIARIVRLSSREEDWKMGQEAFQAVRRLSIDNLDLGQQNSVTQLVLDIGETAAKIIYNASDEPAPFDFHAGWRMAPRLKKLTDRIGQRNFEEHCWKLLIRKI